jgi:hypothetical protein
LDTTTNLGKLPILPQRPSLARRYQTPRAERVRQIDSMEQRARAAQVQGTRGRRYRCTAPCHAAHKQQLKNRALPSGPRGKCAIAPAFHASDSRVIKTIHIEYS